MADAGGTRRRVKLYTLNEERQWDDRGTGYVTCTSSNDRLHSHNYSIIVKSETDGSILLDSKILLNTKYQKQQETLIVWSEGEKFDLALSFQEKAGCDDIWENICEVQGKDSSFITTDPTSIYESDDESCAAESNENFLNTTINLPSVDLAHIREIVDLFQPEKVRDASRRDNLARSIEMNNYIKKLIDLFHQCEDLENIECLHYLYDIIRGIFYLNKSSLFEILFSDELILDVIGCLEYDPNKAQHQQQNELKHREFLDTKATFKEVIPIGNQELLSKIHQTYRIQYIQDAILPAPSLFEENLLSTMNSFLFFNKVEIVTLLYEDPKFLTQLFSTLKDDNVSDEKRKDLMLFLKEFCVFSQTLQQQNRDAFFQALASQGILTVIQLMLSLDDITIKQAALDVFASIVECNPSTVREYMLHETQATQDDDELLLNLVISEIRSDPDPELSGALNLMNFLKLLIDPDGMLATSIGEKTEFLSFFYIRSMPVLLAPLMANTSDLKLGRDDFHTAQLQNLILDFVTFCVEHHTYPMRNFLNKKDLLRRVLVLLKSKHQFLQLSALRFLRRIIGLKDEQYTLSIVHNNLLQPVVEAFKSNGRRYNLLNSALIELFEFIRQEDLKALLMYVVENFYSDFESVTYVKTFKEMKIRYDQHRDKKERSLIDSGTPIISRMLEQRHRKDARDLDIEEENWFNDDDENNDSQQQNHDLTLDNNNENGLDDAQATTTLDSTDDLSLISQQRNFAPYSRSNHLKSAISIHIRRPNPSLPISVGQLYQSSSIPNSTSYSLSSSLSSINYASTIANKIHKNNDHDLSLRLDIPSSSSSLESSIANESSSITMSPGLRNIAQYQDQDSDEDDQNPTLEDEAEEEASEGGDIEINETISEGVAEKPQLTPNTILTADTDDSVESNQSACVSSSSSSSCSTENITQSEGLYHDPNSVRDDINNLSNNSSNNQYSDKNGDLLTKNTSFEETPTSSEEIISSSSTSCRKRNRSDNDITTEDISTQEAKVFCRRSQNDNSNVEITAENSNDVPDEEER